MLVLNNVTDAMVTENTFYGVNPSTVAQENGVYLMNAHSVRIAGNNFNHMRPYFAGSCIVIDAASNVVRVTDNLFSDVSSKLNNLMPPILMIRTTTAISLFCLSNQDFFYESMCPFSFFYSPVESGDLSGGHGGRRPDQCDQCAL